MKSNIICNPINIDYKYQEVQSTGMPTSIYREAADPTVIMFKDKYFLFPSVSAGFWWSTDLTDWKYVERRELPIYDYAPDVRLIGDYMYFSASRNKQNCSLYRTKDPINEGFEEVSELFPFWDPNLFSDEDGRIYLYWGCSNSTPIYGIEIDSKSFKKIGEPVELIKSCPENHGWERTGVNNDPDCFEDEYSKAVAAFVGTKPFIEGAYMTKNNGKYYLQYSAPATERNTYADGVYVGDSPLGPFVYCKHNPFSLKPGGFITGAGHGSTFEDKYGNWWHVSTMRININNPMERRIGLFPAGFDSDGLLYCNQNYADYPFKIPNEKINPNDINPEMMLISYKKPVKASSVEDGYKASNITNENIRDIWVAKSNNEGEYVEIDLQSTARVSAIQLNFADSKIDAPSRDESVYYAKGHSKRFINLNSGCIRYRLEGSTDSESWFILKEKENIQESLQHEFLCFEKEILCRYLRITLLEQPYHQKFAMSDIRVFGKIDKSLPAKTVFEAKRNSPTSVSLKWKKIQEALGYNIRYGIAPDKLYNSWQLYDETEYRLNGLNAGIHYYFCVDTYNESGITFGDIQYLE